MQGKEIIVFRDGTALNFREKSVPTEIFDLIYAEVLLYLLELLTNQGDLKNGMNELSYQKRSTIANWWLQNNS